MCSPGATLRGIIREDWVIGTGVGLRTGVGLVFDLWVTLCRIGCTGGIVEVRAGRDVRECYVPKCLSEPGSVQG